MAAPITTVKAFVELPGGRGRGPSRLEVRRFPATEPSSVVEMKRKINQLYPELENETLKFSWTDPDGDDVTMSTDDELAEAMGFITDGLIRIKVQAARRKPWWRCEDSSKTGSHGKFQAGCDQSGPACRRWRRWGADKQIPDFRPMWMRRGESAPGESGEGNDPKENGENINVPEQEGNKDASNTPGPCKDKRCSGPPPGLARRLRMRDRCLRFRRKMLNRRMAAYFMNQFSGPNPFQGQSCRMKESDGPRGNHACRGALGPHQMRRRWMKMMFNQNKRGMDSQPSWGNNDGDVPPARMFRRCMRQWAQHSEDLDNLPKNAGKGASANPGCENAAYPRRCMRWQRQWKQMDRNGKSEECMGKERMDFPPRMFRRWMRQSQQNHVQTDNESPSGPWKDGFPKPRMFMRWMRQWKEMNESGEGEMSKDKGDPEGENYAFRPRRQEGQSRGNNMMKSVDDSSRKTACRPHPRQMRRRAMQQMMRFWMRSMENNPKSQAGPDAEETRDNPEENMTSDEERELMDQWMEALQNDKELHMEMRRGRQERRRKWRENLQRTSGDEEGDGERQDGDWTMMGDIVDEDNVEVISDDEREESNNREKTQEQELIVAGTVNESDPKASTSHNDDTDISIRDALVQMEAMGFHDEGGWLSRLLMVKEGDIAAVLDAIKPAGASQS